MQKLVGVFDDDDESVKKIFYVNCSVISLVLILVLISAGLFIGTCIKNIRRILINFILCAYFIQIFLTIGAYLFVKSLVYHIKFNSAVERDDLWYGILGSSLYALWIYTGLQSLLIIYVLKSEKNSFKTVFSLLVLIICSLGIPSLIVGLEVLLLSDSIIDMGVFMNSSYIHGNVDWAIDFSDKPTIILGLNMGICASIFLAICIVFIVGIVQKIRSDTYSLNKRTMSIWTYMLRYLIPLMTYGSYLAGAGMFIYSQVQKDPTNLRQCAFLIPLFILGVQCFSLSYMFVTKYLKEDPGVKDDSFRPEAYEGNKDPSEFVHTLSDGRIAVDFINKKSDAKNQDIDQSPLSKPRSSKTNPGNPLDDAFSQYAKQKAKIRQRSLDRLQNRSSTEEELELDSLAESSKNLKSSSTPVTEL